MRKQTKLVAVLSTAALLAIGASMTSFAAQGWAEEDATWVYYDKNGDKVTDSWKKSGDNWYYLDSDGEMAADVLIEDDDNYYYVDENGAMVRNQWVAVENEDAGEEDEPDHYWYYFQSNGKAYKRSDDSNSLSPKTINGKKYAFDTDGKMLYGWVNDSFERDDDDEAWKNCQYYLGGEDDGAVRTNEWALIAITDDDAAKDQPGDDFWDEDQERWFYFKASGKKQGESTNKKINGKKYGFDEYGRMVASWNTTLTPVDKDATASNMATVNNAYVNIATSAQGTETYTESFMYFSNPEDGARYTKGWFKVVPGYYLQQGKYEDDSEYWYYADGDGNLMYHGMRCQHNLTSPKYLEFCEKITRRMAEHFNKYDCIIGWQLDNEVNCETNEYYSKSDHEAFRAFLKERFGTLDNLNEKMGTIFWSQTYTDWDQIHLARRRYSGHRHCKSAYAA